MPRAYWTGEDPDREFIENRVHYWAHKLAKTQRPAAEDREDMEQALRLDLLLRLPRFDARRASRRTFISRVVEHHALTILEQRRAAKRDQSLVKKSLDAPTDPDSPEAGTHGDLISDDDYHDRLSDRTPAEVQRNLALSVSIALAGMPKTLRRTCELLHEGFTVTEIAAQLGLHRCTASGHVAEIRRRLRARGFEL